jgi:Uma2 family endonuclease
MNIQFEICRRAFSQAPDTEHQRISLRLAAALYRQLNHLGTVMAAPCNVQLSQSEIVQPDILFIRKERIGIISELHVQGSPDLIVEIVSQFSGEQDVAVKRRIYSRFGVKECWIVSQLEQAVEIWAWCEIGYILAGQYRKSKILRSPFWTSLRIPLSEIFV